ncbi:hypothetical protein [Pectobacterium actinidiae]|uniref:hypothetical protein n=1 Tax=Pectobacterium actinidiae TaxID=1507808 RepID=UPI00380C7EFA
MKKIKLMADYQCHPLWGTTPDDFGDIAPDELPISVQLIESLRQWAEQYDNTLNMDDPASSGFSNAEEEAEFKRQGDILSQRLRDELGSEYEIIYHR